MSKMFIWLTNHVLEEGKRIAILNIGTTRADHLADLKIHARAGDVLSQLLW